MPANRNEIQKLYDQAFHKNKRPIGILENEKLPRDIPIIPLEDILKTRADRDILAPLIEQLNPYRRIPLVSKFKIPLLNRTDDLEFLHRGITKFVPDYNMSYLHVGHDSVPEKVGQIIESANKVSVAQELGMYAKKHKVREIEELPTFVKEETSKGIRAKIAELVNYIPHEVRKTIRVGKIRAVEVLPINSRDPLYCVSDSGEDADALMNLAFESAFVRAIAGRVNNDIDLLNQAVKLGKNAGNTALSNCLGGLTEMSLAELLFVSHLVFDTGGDFMINGFASIGGKRFRGV